MTIQVGLERRGARFTGYLATQDFRVKSNGTFSETFVIPKDVSTKKKTQYLLVFRGTSKKYPTFGPLWLGWMQARRLQHFIFVESGILALMVLLFIAHWFSQDKKHV